jgi:hypothetical protein
MKNKISIFSLVLGVLTACVVPILTLIVAPCGFPTALVFGIAAILTGSRARKEIAVNGEAGVGMANTGIVIGGIGLVINTFAMLLKLGMFVGIIVLPILAILHGNQQP